MSRTRFLVGAFLLLRTFAAAPAEYEFEGDVIRIPEEWRAPPDEKEQLRLAGICAHEPGQVPELDGVNVRKGVELRRFPYAGLVAVEGGVHTQVVPENLGLFLSEIRKSTEAQAALSLLFDTNRHIVSVEAYHALLDAIALEKTENKAFALIVADRRINEKLVRAACQLDENKHWRWCVLRWEGTRIYEYKIVATSDMKIGITKHVLVDGPEGFGGVGSIVVEVLSPEARAKYEAWRKAVDFISKVLRPYIEKK